MCSKTIFYSQSALPRSKACVHRLRKSVPAAPLRKPKIAESKNLKFKALFHKRSTVFLKKKLTLNFFGLVNHCLIFAPIKPPPKVKRVPMGHLQHHTIRSAFPDRHAFRLSRNMTSIRLAPKHSGYPPPTPGSKTRKFNKSLNPLFTRQIAPEKSTSVGDCRVKGKEPLRSQFRSGIHQMSRKIIHSELVQNDD